MLRELRAARGSIGRLDVMPFDTTQLIAEWKGEEVRLLDGLVEIAASEPAIVSIASGLSGLEGDPINRFEDLSGDGIDSIALEEEAKRLLYNALKIAVAYKGE